VNCSGTVAPVAADATPETATVAEPAAAAWNVIDAMSPLPEAPACPVGREIAMSIRPAV